MPQIYEDVTAEMMAVAIDRVRLNSYFGRLTTSEIVEVSKTLTYASRVQTVYHHTAGYSVIQKRIAKVRNAGFLLANEMTRIDVSSRFSFEEKRFIHQAILDFSSHIARQYRTGDRIYENLGPIAIHAINLNLNDFENILVSEETENGLTKGIINAVFIKNTTLQEILSVDTQSSTLVVLFTDSIYYPKGMFPFSLLNQPIRIVSH